MLDGKLKIIKTIFLHRIEIIITSSVDCRSRDPCTYPLMCILAYLLGASYTYVGWVVKSFQRNIVT